MKGKNKEIIIAHPLHKLWMLPKRSIARTLPMFLSSCSFSLFFFLLLAAFFVGQLLVKIKRAWTSSVSLQVIPVAFSSWRIFALCLHKSARPVCLSWIFYWLWILDDQGHSVYSYLVPCISSFLASIRKLEGFHNSVTLLGIAPNHVCLTTPSPLQRKEPKVINVWRQTTSVLKKKGRNRLWSSIFLTCKTFFFAKSWKTQTRKFQCDSLVLVYEDLYQSKPLIARD